MKDLIAEAEKHFEATDELDTFWAGECLTAWKAAEAALAEMKGERDDYVAEIDMHIKDLGELQGHFADCRQERDRLKVALREALEESNDLLGRLLDEGKLDSDAAEVSVQIGSNEAALTPEQPTATALEAAERRALIHKKGNELATANWRKANIRAEAAEGERDRLDTAIRNMQSAYAYAEHEDPVRGFPMNSHYWAELFAALTPEPESEKPELQICPLCGWEANPSEDKINWHAPGCNWRQLEKARPEQPDSGEAKPDQLPPGYDRESSRWICHSCGRNAWFQEQIDHTPDCPFAQQDTGYLFREPLG